MNTDTWKKQAYQSWTTEHQPTNILDYSSTSRVTHVNYTGNFKWLKFYCNIPLQIYSKIFSMWYIWWFMYYILDTILLTSASQL